MIFFSPQKVRSQANFIVFFDLSFKAHRAAISVGMSNRPGMAEKGSQAAGNVDFLADLARI